MAAPRITPRLEAAIARADDPFVPIAEVCRRAGAAAEELGLPRPSYESVRAYVHRARRRRREPGTATFVADVIFRVRPPTAVLDHASGVGVPRLDRVK
jgi:hypothetical protein